MREHKYRAWGGEPARMVYFGLFESPWFPTAGSCETGPDDQTPIMEYTGLKDKNGKDVYEGDIVRIGEDHWSPAFAGKAKIVEYDTQRAFFEPFGDGDWSPVQDADEAYEFEVIGNMFENPDLLK